MLTLHPEPTSANQFKILLADVGTRRLKHPYVISVYVVDMQIRELLIIPSRKKPVVTRLLQTPRQPLYIHPCSAKNKHGQGIPMFL